MVVRRSTQHKSLDFVTSRLPEVASSRVVYEPVMTGVS